MVPARVWKKSPAETERSYGVKDSKQGFIPVRHEKDDSRTKARQKSNSSSIVSDSRGTTR